VSGTLFVVATPIGHLGDITLRALETLKTVGAIACEDTRQTGKLLSHYKIYKPLISLHDHNERVKTPELVNRLRAGESFALVSDGGTPLIADPGWRLVHEAIGAGVAVTWIPGATALIGALVLSGLPTDRFVFEGFLPPKSAARRKRLDALKDEARTIVLYESPHRLLKALADIKDVLGEVPMVCARELTKMFEEVQRGTASELLAHFERHAPKGEFVIVIGR
jgi:16S rRNA (cytidine1402-2'-O)-methyltransferase